MAVWVRLTESVTQSFDDTKGNTVYKADDALEAQPIAWMMRWLMIWKGLGRKQPWSNWGTAKEFAWRHWGKPRMSVRLTSDLVNNWNGRFLNTSQKLFSAHFWDVEGRLVCLLWQAFLPHPRTGWTSVKDMKLTEVEGKKVNVSCCMTGSHKNGTHTLSLLTALMNESR